MDNQIIALLIMGCSILVIVQAVLLFCLPFFIYRIRNEVIKISYMLSKIDR